MAEKRSADTVYVPIVPVSLYRRSEEIEVPIENITGGDLKEIVGGVTRTPKNRQILVVLNPERTLIEKILHDETAVSAAELANVCVLECRLEPVVVLVKVRWPKRWRGLEAECETINMSLRPDDLVSSIRKEVETRKNLQILDCVVLHNRQEIDENETLSYCHISSNSEVNLIVVDYSNTPQSSGAPSYAGSEGPLSDTSCDDFPDSEGTAQLPMRRTSSQKLTRSTPNFRRIRRHSIQLHSGQQGIQSLVLLQPDARSQQFPAAPLLPRIIQSPTVRTPVSRTSGRIETEVARLPRISRNPEGESQDENSISGKGRRRYPSEGQKEMAQMSSDYNHPRQKSWDSSMTGIPSRDSVPDLVTLIGALTEARARWYDIGLALKVEPGTLDAISSETSDPVIGLRRMLMYRRKMDPTLTWPIVVKALNHSILEEKQLAKKIEDKYILYFNTVYDTYGYIHQQ